MQGVKDIYRMLGGRDPKDQSFHLLMEGLRAGFRTRFRCEKAQGRGQAEAERRRRIPMGDTARSDNEGMARPSAFAAETRVLKPALRQVVG